MAPPFQKGPVRGDRTPAVRWFKEWVPQDLLATGGKCMVRKWVTEDMLKALKEKFQEPESEEPEPEPTTEVLFLCTYHGCGKTFADVTALKKHSHVHGERQYPCHYEGCGKKFLDSSKLKRHFLTHTGERAHVCTYEGCGKAFSLDFNLRAHMQTHSQENYHVCPYEGCGRKYAHMSKLQAHVKAQHEKNAAISMTKRTPREERVHVATKPATIFHSDRPYVCPYEGCDKSYIHEYKLRLHLRREHPGHNSEGNGKHTPSAVRDMDDATERDAYFVKSTPTKSLKRIKPAVLSKKLQSSKFACKAPTLSHTNLDVAKNKCPTTKEANDEDSEEAEEECENDEEHGWRYQGTNGDEETEDEE